MLAVTRYRVDAGSAADFVARARPALRALADRPGHLWGCLGRATDDPAVWTLTTLWTSVGDYRRALGSYDVKLNAHPFLYGAADEPTAFETLLWVDGDGPLRESASDRAENADTADIGDPIP